MSAITPTTALVAYLAADSTLQGLAPGGVWEDPAPQGQATPLVVVDYVTAVDRHYGACPRLTEFTYIAKAVGPASQVTAVLAAAERIDALLHDGPLVLAGLAGFRVLRSQRNEPVEYPEPETVNGIRWVHRGGIYEFDAEAVT